MVVLRCTQSLLLRLKLIDEEDAPRSTTALGDWYGNLIRLGRRHALLFLSERSRLPVLLPVRDADRLSVAFPAAVSEILTSLGVEPGAIARGRSEMSPFRVGRTANRSVVGSLTDFSFLARARFITGREVPLRDVALELSETPVTPLGYELPSTVTRRLLTGERRAAAILATTCRRGL